MSSNINVRLPVANVCASKVQNHTFLPRHSGARSNIAMSGHVHEPISNPPAVIPMRKTLLHPHPSTLALRSDLKFSGTFQ
jgi:hypothetical protein